MPKFNEPDLFLLRQWQDARLLEDAMETVREKYVDIFRTALEEFQKNHAGLNYPVDKYVRTYGSAGVGKESWLSKRWPSGFWIDNVRLEDLTSPEKSTPSKSVCINDSQVDPLEAEKTLRKSAEKILSKEELARVEFTSTATKAWLSCSLEQSPAELFERLVQDDARDFVSCMIDHFEWLARFTPAVDEIVTSGKRGRR